MRDEAHAAIDRLFDAIECSANIDEKRSAQLELQRILRQATLTDKTETASAATNEMLLRLVAALDELERTRSLNDPERIARAKDKSYQEAAAAFADLFGDVALERAAAACVGRFPWDHLGVGPEALKVAQGGIDPVSLRGNDGRNDARNVIVRLVLDHARLLPPGLAVQVAHSLLELNLGSETEMFIPYRMKGLRPNRSRKTIANLAVYARIYYSSGYDELTLEGAIEKEGSTAPEWMSDQISTDTIHKFATRNKARSFLNEHKIRGQEDRLAGRSFSPPLAADYSLEQLKVLGGSG